MHMPKFGQLVEPADKRLIFGPPTQALLPLKYHEIYDAYKSAIKNNWTPEEIGLAEDRYQYSELDEPIRNQWDKVLSMLTVMDMVVTDSIGEHIMPAASAPEFRAWLARQTFEEANHSDSYAYIIDGIGLEQQAVFDRYLTDETLYAKIEMAEAATKKLKVAENRNKSVTISKGTSINHTIEAAQSFIKGYSFFPLVLEGVWFTMGLKCGTYASQFQGKMRGTSDQFAYILRDEMLHTVTGIRVLRTIIREYPEAWTQDVQKYILAMVDQSISLEEDFAERVYAGLPGLPVYDYIEHCKYQAEQWLRQLDLSLYPKAQPRIRWLSEAIETRKEANFFERRVTEYQQGTGLSWED